LVLDQGEVLEVGTHTQLMEAGGSYASMWARQESVTLGLS